MRESSLLLSLDYLNSFERETPYESNFIVISMGGPTIEGRKNNAARSFTILPVSCNSNCANYGRITKGKNTHSTTQNAMSAQHSYVDLVSAAAIESLASVGFHLRDRFI